MEKPVIGVDLGGTKILAGVVDRDGHVEHRREHPTPTASQDELLAGPDAAVEELLTDEIAALGFGLPSPIDQRGDRSEEHTSELQSHHHLLCHPLPSKTK